MSKAKSMAVALRTLLSFVQLQGLILQLELPFPDALRSMLSVRSTSSSMRPLMRALMR